MHDNPPSRLFLGLFMAAYFCAGFGYVISATFIVAIVEQAAGAAGAGRAGFPGHRPGGGAGLHQLGFHRPLHRRPRMH